MSRIPAPQLMESNWTAEQQDLARATRLYYNGSGAKIAAGSAVVQDLSISTATAALGQAIKKDTTADSPGFIGVVDVDIPNLTWGMVVVQGTKTLALAEAGIAAGDLVQKSGVAGTLEKAFATTERAVGRALTATASGSITVVLFGAGN